MSNVVLLDKFARYPWSARATEYITDQQMDLTSLAQPQNKPLVTRGFTRVLEAIDDVEGDVPQITDAYQECLSFPVARMMVEAINDDALRHRFAIRESKRAFYFLKREDEGAVFEMVDNTFHWALKAQRHIINNRIFELTIAFQDYIQIAPLFHDAGWKMVNRDIDQGWIYLDTRQLKRLIAEAVKNHILGRRVSNVNLKGLFDEEIKSIKQRWQSVRSRWGGGEFTGEAWVEGFPPCIRELLAFTREGQNISHLGRFALATFLLHVGLSIEDIVDLFRKAPDFQQDLARYQVRHISGEFGSGTKYTPPSCATLQTHHLCRAGDDKICQCR